MKSATILEAIDDPDILGPWFKGESWQPWRTVLKAAFGVPLDDEELAFFRTVAERDPPGKPVQELWIIVGRRGGKDSVASAIATDFAALHDYTGLLRPGERASILCLACDREQARIVKRYISGYFAAQPLLKAMVKSDNDETLELKNAAEITVATNSFRAVRGRTLACVIMDELAFWRDENTATPDRETYNALKPGLSTLGDAMLIGISSPYRKAGLLYEKYRKHYGKPDPNVLVIKAPSRALNPTLPQEIVDQALIDDPEIAAAEWLGEFRRDIVDFISREIIERLTTQGIAERPPVAGIEYRAFTDPSGGSSDSMTLAIGHRDSEGRGILDAVRDVRPPFSPNRVCADFAALLRSYRVSEVTGDHYAGEWPRERFREHGIEYRTSDQSKSDIYRELLPLLNGGQVELLDVPRLASQFVGLERRTGRGSGKDIIDHAPNAHDDLANSAAGVLVMVAAKRIAAAGWLQYAAEIVEERKNPQAETKQSEPKIVTIPLHALPIIEVKWTRTEDKLPTSGTFIEISADGQRPSGKVQFHPGAWIPPYWKKVVQ